MGDFRIENPGSSASGDVAGPASSTDNAVARFDGTTGKLVQNSGITISDGNIMTWPNTGQIVCPGSGTNSTKIGSAATASGLQNTVLGDQAAGSANNATALGFAASGGHAPCIVIGDSAASVVANGFVAGSQDYPMNDVAFGKGYRNLNATEYTIHGTHGFGSNRAGGNLKLAGGAPTGSGTGGSLILQTAPAGGSSSTLQTLVDHLTISSAGVTTIATSSDGSITAAVLTSANSQAVLRVNGSGDSSPLSIRNTSDSVNAMTLSGESANANVQFNRYSADVSGAVFIGRKARGTVGSPGQSLSGDFPMVFQSNGTNASAGEEQAMATFRSILTENTTTTAHGSGWEFYTVANTTTTQVQTLFLDQDASVTIPSGAFVKFAERSTNPANPTQDVQVNMYVKADKLVFQFNNGGTVRYFTLDLTQSIATPVWAQSTSAP